MTVYFNENDPYPAQWLRNLYPDATVDERSILDVQPGDLSGYTRVHLFAGIAGWEYALSLAGWPQGREVFTGSCPCQPFSVAGKGRGTEDERHLWPEMRRLIAECRPPTVFGEQVASRAGREWLAGVRADLEALGYAVGAADLCAASAGAPHIRQRLFWVADAGRFRGAGRGVAGDVAGTPRDAEGKAQQRERLRNAAHDGSPNGGLADTNGDRQRPGGGPIREPQEWDNAWRSGPDGWLAHPERDSRGAWRASVEPREGAGAQGAGPHAEPGRRCDACGHDAHWGLCQFWLDNPDGRGEPCWCDAGGLGDADDEGPQGRGLRPAGDAGQRSPWAAGAVLIPCADGKARRIEPGIQPLAHGVPARVGRLRAYGNAIVPPLGAAFIRAFLEAERDW